ncbi:MAG: HAMP domain-containing sensor histidine kinase [Pseudomonadota bacterium]
MTRAQLHPPSLVRRTLLGLLVAMLSAVSVILLVIAVLVGQQTQQGMIRTNNADMAALVALYESQPPEALRDYVDRSLQFAPARGGDRVIGLQLSRDEPLIGNLDAWPAELDAQRSPAQTAALAVDGETGRWVVRATALRGGARILVGREAGYVGETVQRFLAVSGLALLALGAVSFVYAGFVSRRFQTRTDTILKACDAIAAGDLDRRLETSSRDELGRISDHINVMVNALGHAIHHHKQSADQMAHELRNPLARANAFLERIESNPGKSRDDAERARSELRLVVQTLDDMLDIAELEVDAQGRQRFEAVDLAALAADIVGLYQPAAEDRGITLTTDLASLGEVQADPSLVRRAVANLMDNALKNTPDNGQIRVTLVSEARGFDLSVENTGSRVPDGDLNQVFERFYRRGEQGGRGLGLAFVAAIAKRHGWTAKAQNTEDGVRIELTGFKPSQS